YAYVSGAVLKNVDPVGLDDVMIVPTAPMADKKTGALSEEQQNQIAYRDFAKEWAAAGDGRKVLEMNSGASNKEVLEVLKSAAATAGKDGTIIYNIGHGGVGRAIPVEGPNRHSDTSGFDLVPFRSPEERRFLSTTDMVVKDGGKNWRRFGDESLTGNRDMMRKVGEEFRKAGIKQFHVLACNAGQDPRFGRELSRTLGVQVALHKDFIAMAQKDGKVHMWTDAVREPEAIPTRASASEVPKAKEQRGEIFAQTRAAAYGLAVENGAEY
ncbi:MAG TPA: hypothetical protein VIV60_25150, partial [Polyangiaceae bacterium]